MKKVAIKNIVSKVISNVDYRDEVLLLIDELFLNFCIDFFKRVVDAKIKNQNISEDWYKKEFLNPDLKKEELAINSGTNMKTITNSYNTSRKEIVIEASEKNYERLFSTISDLVESENDLNLTLTIKFRNVSVDLTLNESLIVINTLAVKRAEIRGGMWSAAGKQVEKPLMITLCRLYDVPYEMIDQSDNPNSFREVDFYILSKDGKKIRVEVKLMGKGNPESADAIFAREPGIFVADKLSDKNKKQAEMLGIQWVQLRTENGYSRFLKALKNLNVQHSDFQDSLEARLNIVLSENLF